MDKMPNCVSPGVHYEVREPSPGIQTQTRKWILRRAKDCLTEVLPEQNIHQPVKTKMNISNVTC